MVTPSGMPDRMQDFVLAVDAYRRAFADVLGLGVAEMLTLADLERQGPEPVSMIAARLGVAAPGGTALVDRLQSRGLVVRRPHPSDRRSTLVDLTPRGHQVASIMRRLFGTDVDAAVAGVPGEQLDELADLVDRVAAALRQRAGDVNRLRRDLLREDLAPPEDPAADDPEPERRGEPEPGAPA
jgi:DNA-binding MarR family transcriptional regulator